MHATLTYPAQPGGRFFRKKCVRGYCFGFNGKEKLDEVYGDANAYDFGARLYDPRLGRWLAVDPLAGALPSWGPYTGMKNNPVLLIDKEGEFPIIPIPFLLVKAAATLSNKVAYFSGSIGGSAGVVQAGAGGTYQQMFAADPFGNYAFVGSLGMFAHFLNHGTSNTGNKPGPENGGSWFLGLSASAGGDIGFFSFSNVQSIAGNAKQLNIGGEPAPASLSVNMSTDHNPNGGQASLGVGAGGGFGVLDSRAYVFAFTLEDFAKAGLNINAAVLRYGVEKVTSDYSDVSLNLDFIKTSDKTFELSINITGVDSKGATQSIKKITIMEFTTNNDNTLLKTGGVSNEGTGN